MACVSRWMVGVFAALLFGIAPPPAAAQSGRSAALRVDAFDVEQVASLAPGTALFFSVFATPGAAATVMVDGVRRLVELREVQPGVYEGSLVIDAADRMRPESAAVATVWRDGAVARATLEESLLLDGASPLHASALPSAPAVTSSPVPITMPSPPMAVPSPAAAFPSSRPVPPSYAQAAPEPRPVPPVRLAACNDCAVVEAIRAVEVPSGPAALGAIAGGIAGAVFGDKIGKEHERHVTRVLGAIGGALVGHQIERSARTRYDASLRLPNGALQVRRYASPPPFHVGETIRLEAAGPAESARSF
ncbi:MAG: glycine zipper 2TM domain-containing protein [Burkholderiales bacterium]|nr:glycine zipper 2TM domain-containing protein [Burkholderiales bacterium]